MLLAFLILTPLAMASTGFSAYVVEHKTKRVLYEHSADEPRYPASITKVMTLYLVFEDLKKKKINLKTPVKFSAYAASTEPSKLGVKAGDSISMKLAIDALIVKSANDVAVAVAETLAGSEKEFVKRMNQKAKQLGMRNTTFRNPHGLFHAEQVTTARDLATLGIAIYEHFPKYYDYFSTETVSYGGITHKSHNQITKTFPGADGLKTGYIRKSGSNLLSSAKKGRKRVFAVVLGGRNTKERDGIMESLLTESFAPVRQYRQQIEYAVVMDQTVLFTPRKGVNSDKTVLRDVKSKTPKFEPSPQIKLAAKPQSNPAPTKKQIAKRQELLAGDAVQVGAFTHYQDAQNQARLTERRTGIDRISIVHEGGLYKVWLTGFSNNEAHSTCELLKTYRSACFVVRNPSVN